MSTEDMGMNVGIDDLFGIDVEVVDPSFGSLYPIVQWVNGDPGKKKSGGIQYTGGFFISAEQGIEVPGATPYQFLTADGDEVDGFAIRDLRIIPIRYRRSWLAAASEKALQQRFPWNAYEDAKEFDHKDSPRGRAQLLCLIEGMDTPVVLTMTGMSAAAVLSAGRDRGVIPTFAQVILQRARALAYRAGRTIDYPLCSFKLTVGPKRDDKDAPVFDKVGSGSATSQVTLPVWVDKPTGMPDEAEIKRRFVGRETFGKVQAIHKEADEWVAGWGAEQLIEQLKRSISSRFALKSLRDAVGDADGDNHAGLPSDRALPF